MSILGASRRDDAACCSVCGTFGPAVDGSANVETNSRGALRMGHQGVYAECCKAPAPVPWTARVGALTVLINQEPAVVVVPRAL
jgi:hypothetical protein